MRLAYLCTDPGIPVGGTKGASVHVASICGALASTGADVLLLPAHVERDAALPAGVAAEQLPGPGKGTPASERLAAEPLRAAWLERRLREHRADALVERMALHSAAGSRAARRLGIAHVVELNSPLPAEASRYRRLDAPEEADRLEREVLGEASVVTTVSRPLVGYARSRGAHTVELMPNAVAMERFPRAAPQHDPPVAVLSGTLRPWHGTDVVAEAWRRLGATAPDLLVVGEEREGSALADVGARVTGPLPAEQAQARLLSADIGLVPYAADAPDHFSPLKLFEYLAAGLAVVAADIPGVTDVVDQRTAVIVPRGDARALAAAVSELAADPERRARLGVAGRALVAEQHTWGHRAETLAAIVRRIAARAVPA